MVNDLCTNAFGRKFVPKLISRILFVFPTGLIRSVSLWKLQGVGRFWSEGVKGLQGGFLFVIDGNPYAVLCTLAYSLNTNIASLNMKLEGTARYAGLLLAPAEGFDFRPRLFLAFGPKKELFMRFVLILGHFWCSVVTLVTLKIIQKISRCLVVALVTLRIIQKISRHPKEFQNLKKYIKKTIQTIKKNSTKISKKSKNIIKKK